MSNRGYATQYVGDSPMLMEAMRLRNQRRLQQSSQGAELERQKLAGQQGLDLENLRFKNESMRDTAKAGRETELERLKAENAKLLAERNQALAVMQQAGLISNPQTENEKTFSQALTDPTIRNMLIQTQNRNDIMTKPDYQQALERGMTAGAEAPAYENIKTGTVTTPPGGITVVPPPTKPPGNVGNWNQIQGATTSEIALPAPSIPTKSGPMTIGDPTMMRVQQPGRIRLPQNILDAASSQNTMTNLLQQYQTRPMLYP